MPALLIDLQAIELEVAEPVRTRILHPIDLRIEAGSSTSVVGPSGAGKTTLATIIGHLQRPSGGRYRFDGEDVTELDARHSARFRQRHLGFVFQHPSLIDERSAWRNVAVALLDPQLDGAEVEARCRGALDTVGLGPVADREASLLSGGERQRVAIARAMVKQPRLVIADEPTGSLDQVTSRSILQLLFTIVKQGATLVMVTHDREVAARADRTVEIVDGRLVG